MPVQMSIKVDAKLVRKGLENLSSDIPKIGRQTIYDKLQPARDELAKSPTRRKALGVWDSERQKLAYFRSGGFGSGIPYSPTGKAGRMWKLTRKASGWMLRNTFKAAKWLWGTYRGERQSAIHAGRRPVFKEVLDRAIGDLPKEIEKRIKYKAKSVGL